MTYPRVEAAESESTDGGPRNIQTFEPSVFIVQMVKDAGGMKIINLGVGN